MFKTIFRLYFTNLFKAYSKIGKLENFFKKTQIFVHKVYRPLLLKSYHNKRNIFKQ